MAVVRDPHDAHLARPAQVFEIPEVLPVHEVVDLVDVHPAAIPLEPSARCSMTQFRTRRGLERRASVG